MADELIGRSADIAAVMALIRSGSRTACVLGEPGAGKSAVLGVASDVVGADGWQVATLRGRQSERDLAFAGVVDLLMARELKIVDHLRDRADRLARRLRVADGSPDALGLRLEILSWLNDVASTVPLLVVVDDQQWLDDSSWSVLSFVARRLAGSSVSFLAASRSGTGAALLEDLPTVSLDPLDLEQSTSLLDGFGVHLDSIVQIEVLERAAGNPLALRELARVAGTRTAASTGVETWVVPPRVEAAFAAELPMLPDETRGVLLLAAAGGTDLSVLSRAHGPHALAGDLAPAEAAGLVSVVGGRVRFRHPLVQETVYASVSAHERMAAHRRLAEVYDDDPERRIWHRSAAAVHPDEEIAAGLVAAGEVAGGRGAFAEAADALLRAAELSPSKVDRDRRMLQAITMLAQTGHVARIGALSERIRRESTDPGVRAEAGHQLAYAMAQSMRQRAAMDALELALGELLAVDVDGGWASLTSLASLAYQTGRDPQRVRAWYDRYARDAESTPEPYAELTRAAQGWIEASLAPLSRPAELLRLVRDTRPLDQELPSAMVASHEMLLGATAWLLDEPQVAVRRLSKAAEMMRRSASHPHLIQTLMALGQVQFDSGSYAATAQTARQMIDIAEAENLGYYRSVGRELAARAAAEAGDADVARSEASAVLEDLEAGECVALEANLRVTLARTQDIAGDVVGSYQQLRSLFDGFGRPIHAHVCYRAVGDLASAAARADQRDDVGMVIEEARRHLDGTGNTRYQVILHRALAQLADGEDAEAFFELAIGNPSAALWPLELGHAQLEYGSWLRRQRRTTEARGHLSAAQLTFTRIGARPWVSLAASALRAAGVGQPDPSSTDWRQLTAQEHQIVRLAGSGMTNREIGQRLFLSPRTVSTHLYHAFPKLGVTSRSQLRDLGDGPDS